MLWVWIIKNIGQYGYYHHAVRTGCGDNPRDIDCWGRFMFNQLAWHITDFSLSNNGYHIKSK